MVIVNAKELFPKGYNSLYSVRREPMITKDYPQVHDFYELFLTIKGSFSLDVNNKNYIISDGQLGFIKPGDIHTKRLLNGEQCNNINFAIKAESVTEIFQFLYNKDPIECISKNQDVFSLSNNQKLIITSGLRYLSLFPIDQFLEKQIYLKKLLLNIFADIIVPECLKINSNKAIPAWMNELLSELQNNSSISSGMDYMVNYTGKTKEHICRSFKKYIGITPIKYLNNKKLNYAANMLQHSDREIVLISEDLGFSSISYFYKCFSEAFGITPAHYRQSSQYSI